MERVGQALTRAKAVFGAEGKAVFVCCGSIVQVYSVDTSTLLHRLRGHTADVTAVQLSPRNSLQLLSASLDGTVRLWDYEDEVCLDVFQLNRPVLCLSICAADPSIGYATLGVASNSNDEMKKTRLVAYSFERREVLTAVAKLGSNTINTDVECRAAGGDDSVVAGLPSRGVSPASPAPASRHFVAALGARRLFVWDSAARKSQKHVHCRKLTALAMHPLDPWVATGDENGVIMLWFCLGTSESALGSNGDSGERQRDGKGADTDSRKQSLVSSTMHWHSRRVTCLAFTPEGSLLLSGGEEGVLVVWQLATGQRDFLPRMGAPIATISVSADGSLVAIATADNALRIVDIATLQTRWKLQGLSISHFDHRLPEPGSVLAVQPRRNVVVLNAWPGSAALQFYDPLGEGGVGRHVEQLQMEFRTVLSQPSVASNTGTTATPTRAATRRVDHVCFSADGLRLATHDTNQAQKGETLQGVESNALRFWNYSKEAQRFELVVVIEQPHQGVVSSLVYHPHADIVVSASFDCTFKVWHRTEEGGDSHDKQSTQKGTWSCRSVGSYRDLAIRSVAFSDDGSLLAAACGHVVTLWDINNVFRSVLVQPPQCGPISRALFVPHTHFMVATTETSLFVWNLLTASVWWSYLLPSSAVALLPPSAGIDGGFVVAVNRTDGNHNTNDANIAATHARATLIVFKASSPVPQYTMEVPDAARAVAVLQDTVLVLGSRRELWHAELFAGTIARDSTETAAASATTAADRHALSSGGGFRRAFGADGKGGAQPSKSSTRARSASGAGTVLGSAVVPGVNVAALQGLLDAPTHELPPFTDLLEPLLSCLIPPAAAARSNARGGRETDISEVKEEQDNGDGSLVATPRRQRQQPQKAEEHDSVVHDEDAEAFASAFEDFFGELTPADNDIKASAEEPTRRVKHKASFASQNTPGKTAKSSKKRKAAATAPPRSRSKSMRKRSTSR